MREEVMSAGVLFAQTSARAEVRPEEKSAPEARGWDPEDFAREQIRGLVRTVFFSNVERPVRQVVFSALDAETDVKSICRKVGEALATETVSNVAVVGEYPQVLPDAEMYQEMIGRPAGHASTLRRAASRVRRNLWLVPAAEREGDKGATASLHSYLGEMRKEFEYSIVAGPPAGESNEALAMAQFADGIILVLSAHHTRRITARKIEGMLEAAQAHILGTVLCDRMFPIPEGIYRRL
ncbi:MAG TPA: hypothetical protein VKF84_08770 [Candidatus Sulfotelmatobacter sp.]|nr:hypothetical protein [Candidatus Sulfotelmatobacter sp.]